ncbi:hypothetical protein I215_08321 [Galbibacter marinus]|uniref:DUF3052 domain-containing protein n=1 Tax=Galbibacter marinus TaxID=555500 RepID=K2PRS0_9FLAO|nr:hypothetical protein [Galbibacter marinus]EKF55235.1 hypothetical protein I215_08321 [Galbibacter marinus]
MKTLFEKLKLENQKEILIINEPEGFAEKLAKLVNIDIYQSLIQVNKMEFALLFVSSIKEFEDQLQTLLPKLKDDVILWVAHPRKKSENLRTDITNDYQWDPLVKKGYDQIKRLKIDSDWEALRFRRAEYIKK